MMGPKLQKRKQSGKMDCPRSHSHEAVELDSKLGLHAVKAQVHLPSSSPAPLPGNWVKPGKVTY